MSVARTYLDFNATAPLREEARAAFVDALEYQGNPSSVHAEGRAALRLIETARSRVATYLGESSREIIFTSGATESNNWVIRSPWSAVVTSTVEHDSVLEPAAQVTCPCHQVGVERNGVIDLGALEDTLDSLLPRFDEQDGDRSRAVATGAVADGRAGVLVSVQAVNGETGVIQPLGEIRRVLDQFSGAYFHVDAVQVRSCHRDLLIDARPDFISVSSHKIGGPKGVGALFVRAGVSLAPMMFGGGQELRRRSGTQSVAAIAGFGAAAQVASSDGEIVCASKLVKMRDDVERGIGEITPSSFVVGREASRVCNTSCVCVPGVRGETLVMAFDIAGIAISAGSACSSGKVTTSHVLKAMGYGREESGSAMRISLGWSSTDDDVERFLNVWRSVTKQILATREGVGGERRQIA